MQVDEHCTLQNCQIYQNYSATLNQVNIGANNNKFYIIQVLVVSNSSFYFWCRYGRVGAIGTTSLEGPSNFNDSLCSKFQRLFKSKTGLTWLNKEDLPKSGKYAYMKLTGTKPDSRLIRSIQLVDKDLGDRTSLFVRELCNEKLMKTAMQSFDIDTDRLPLGNLRIDQIQSAETILKELEDCIMRQADLNSLESLSSRFFTLIPHASKLNQRLPIIKTRKQIQEYAKMLEDLKNIQVASVALNNTNTLKGLYDTLKVELRPVEDVEKQLLSHLLTNTISDDHKIDLELVDAMCIYKTEHDNNDVNDKFGKLESHIMAFHGSRSCNFMGILTEGLRMPRPDQVTNGSILGLGCYFADSSSKSFQYCSKEDHCGYMLLCEIALGKTQIVRGACLDKLPDGFDSRMGCGAKTVVTKEKNGILYPVGPMVLNDDKSFTTFRHNEYVIYKPEQYRFRYLMKVKGKYK